MNVNELHELVEQRLDMRWNEFTEEHPQLAAAIDRVQLIETSVERLLDDPDYHQAVQSAGRDQAMIGVAGPVIDLVDRWVGRLLGI
ncbi:hypothetical protein HED60_12375 [Planctomycetales bacterium ZRK34]|nr:hypothetical protein HED60_12375 [Planctomycetales bacterium ZRK34]